MAEKQKKSRKTGKKNIQKTSEDEFTDITLMLKKIDRSYWITGVVILVIIAAFVAGFFYIKASSNFTYNGISFNKTYFGKILFYTASVPAIDSQGRVVAFGYMDFRNDPRKIKNIPVSASGIDFIKGRTVYISYDANLKICENNMLAAFSLSSFLSDFGLNVSGALDSKEKAKNSSLTYASCENNPNNTVIYITNGNSSEIVQTSKTCYKIISANCQIMETVERFELKMLEEYLAKFKKII